MSSKTLGGMEEGETAWDRGCCAQTASPGCHLEGLQLSLRSSCAFTSLVLVSCHYSADGLVCIF